MPISSLMRMAHQPQDRSRTCGRIRTDHRTPRRCRFIGWEPRSILSITFALRADGARLRSRSTPTNSSKDSKP